MDKKQDEAREKMQEVTIHRHLSEETLNKLPIKRATWHFIFQVQMQMQKLQAAPN